MKTNSILPTAICSVLLGCAMSVQAADVATEKTSTTTVDGSGTTATATTTTTTSGTISEFSPDTIIVRSESAPEPVRYNYTKTTTYVDEAGNAVSMETVKSGLPVTVHYVKRGDSMFANRVVVHKKTTTTTAPAVVEQRKTTTTTTTTEEKK